MTQTEKINPKVSFLKKKNAIRKELASKGIMKREGNNKFDKYSYFSEAQYKALFTDLFSRHGVEMICEEVEIEDIQATNSQPFGRRVKLAFTLTDIDSGYEETTYSTGEGFDKGDKALYKAKTGALKYWLANNFMVATGDDPETESPDGGNGKQGVKPVPKPKQTGGLATEAQIKMINNLYNPDEIAKMLNKLGIDSMTKLTIKQASDMIAFRKKAEATNNE